MTDERKIMIDAHPGGIPLTERLLALGGMDSREKGRKLLDLGAGKGESTEFLRNKGWDARGIDLVCPENSEVVIEMDMRKLEYDASSFDVCLAECSLSGCGDGAAALKEGYRVLRSGGVFLVSDVYFQKEEAPALSLGGPLTKKLWLLEFMQAGFSVCCWEDETPLWREFFLESLWNGKADETCAELFREYGKGKCGYFLAVLKKGGVHGLI